MKLDYEDWSYRESVSLISFNLMEVLTREVLDEIMDAILPADVVDDEVPSSFTIVGHVGKCFSGVRPYELH